VSSSSVQACRKTRAMQALASRQIFLLRDWDLLVCFFSPKRDSKKSRLVPRNRKILKCSLLKQPFLHRFAMSKFLAVLSNQSCL
jgi:hypothetical protein